MIKMPSFLRPQHALDQLESEEFDRAEVTRPLCEIETVDSIMASIHSHVREDQCVDFAPYPESSRPKTIASCKRFRRTSLFHPEEMAIRFDLSSRLELLKSGYPLHNVSLVKM